MKTTLFRSLCHFAAILCLAFGLAMLPAHLAWAATNVWTGNGGDNDWFTDANWSTNIRPISTEDIHIGSTAGDSTATVVQNSNNAGTTSTNILSLTLGVESASSGTLTVTGADVRRPVTNAITVGDAGDGFLNLTNGGRATAGNVTTGSQTGSTGTITVTGSGSSLNANGWLVVGMNGAGTLTITDGGQARSTGNIDIGGAYSSTAAGATGIVTVSGPGSLLDAGTNRITIGIDQYGRGTLTLENGGKAIANSVQFGNGVGGSGILNIGTGGAAGILDAPTVNAVSSAGGTVNFNHSATAATPYYFTRDGSSGGTGVNLTGNNLAVVHSSGYTVLTGNDTRTATNASTTISGGTLQIGNGGTTGSITGNIVNNAALVFDRSNPFDYAGAISGSGTLTQNGSGTLTLSGANTYTGGTTINTVLTVTGSLGGGSYAGNIANAGTLAFAHAGGQILSGVISGTGSLSKSGAGTLTLSGANTYSGGTNLNDGKIYAGHNSALGTGDLVMLAGTTLGFTGNYSLANAITLIGASTVDTETNNATLSGAITGSGALTKTGSGTLTLTGTNSYSGGTTISAGTLQVTGTLGTGVSTVTYAGAISNNGALVFNQSATQILSGNITGTGSLSKSGSGLLILTGTNTYSGGTTVNAGALHIGYGSSSGSITGNIANSGEVFFNRSDADTYGGVISGTGALTKRGTGILTLSGANTYTGNTTIDTGSGLVFTNTLGSGGIYTGNITNRGTLTFNQSADQTLSGNITGSGVAVIKQGNGILTVNGNVAQAFTLSGGTLAGTGTLGNVTLSSGTKLSPGTGGIGTLTMGNGPTVNFNGVTYVLDVGSGNNSDKIVVNGGANLNGGKIDIASWQNGTYTILTASSGFLGSIAAGDITLAGAALGSRQTAGTSISGTTSLILTLSSNAMAMTWEGTAGRNWNSGVDTNLVWSRNDTPGLTYFINNDTVTFGAIGMGAVNVDAGGVTVNTMAVSVGGYSFTGGAITGATLGLHAPSGSTTFSNEVNFSGGITVEAGNTLAFNYGTAITNNNAITGAGNLSKTGAGTLTLTNLALTGGIAVTGGTLRLPKSGAYTLDNALTGSGTLALDLGANTNALSFGAGVGNAFTGTLELERGTLALDASAATALTNAALRLDSNASATINTSRNIGGLAFNGGTLSFQAFNGSGSISPNTLLTVTNLAVESIGGTVRVDIASLNNILTTAGDYNTFYDYAGASLYQKRIVAATNVSGTGSLNLLDSSGNALSNKAEVRNILEGSDTVGRATFNYTASVDSSSANKGIYLGYGLSQLEALAGKAVRLDSTGSTTATPTINAKLTGAGGFIFTGSQNAQVGNSASDYSGATLVDGPLTVTLSAANAFGATSSLTLQNNGKVNMNGMAQTVGGLAGSVGTEIQLGSLTVNQITDTSFAGTLSGTGSLTKSGGGGILALTGANSYSGGTTINRGLINFSNGGNLGTGNITLNGGGLQWATGNIADISGRLAPLGLNGGILDTNGNDVTFATGVSGGGPLTKTGLGTLTLDASNPFMAALIIDMGNLTLGTNGALTNAPALYMGANTVFDYSTAVAYNAASPQALQLLTVYGAGAKIIPNPGYVADFKNGTMLFNIPASATANSVLLTVDGNADMTGASVSLNTPSGRPNLNAGEKVILLDVTPGNTLTSDLTTLTVQTASGDIYTIQVSGNQLQAILQQLSPTGPAYERLKAYAEGHAASLAFANQGADLIVGQGFGSALGVTMGPGFKIGAFGAASGGKSRYHTGSHIDVSGFSMLAGLAMGGDVGPGRLTLGAFFEGGWGSYSSYNSFSNYASVDGKGNTNYYGGGILVRYDVTQSVLAGLYVDASARMGWSRTDFRSDDIQYNRLRASFETASPYYGLHGGLGYVWKFTDRASLDLSARLVWTRQQGDRVRVHEDRVRFEDADSLRSRLGGRFAYAVNEYITPYIGAFWEHEFDGKARSRVNGIRVGTPSLQGDTGMGEIGLSLKPSKDLPLSFDLGVQGYVGKREGVSGSLQVRFEF